MIFDIVPRSPVPHVLPVLTASEQCRLPGCRARFVLDQNRPLRFLFADAYFAGWSEHPRYGLVCPDHTHGKPFALPAVPADRPTEPFQAVPSEEATDAT